MTEQPATPDSSAVGDGVTDDTEAVQTAVDTAAETGGSVVLDSDPDDEQPDLDAVYDGEPDDAPRAVDGVQDDLTDEADQ